ncbi:MAG: hypothetical protein JWL77_5341 [Chthonomonadaceae bacterium]|nr:hypothetical protein [Chthonomonadaceae bacterium]
MENRSSLRHRLVWIALATLGALLVLPATRYLLRTQLQMESLTYATQTDLSAEAAAASQRSTDYPVQLALATEMSDSFVNPADADPMAQSKARNRRIEALAQRFPNNPSVYANLLRYMTMGEMRVQRDQDIVPPAPGSQMTTSQIAPESWDMFDTAAQKGAQLDPDNAYFPMMRAIGLFNAHRDGEAWQTLKAAASCSRWVEYYQDEAEGRNRLRAATYGERGALPHTSVAANLLFPQYAQLRAVARIAIHLAVQEELEGNPTSAVTIRHAVMRCGGLMRAQGTSYITALVGIALTNIATSDAPTFTPPEIDDVRFHPATGHYESQSRFAIGRVYWHRSELTPAGDLFPIPDSNSLLYGSNRKEETPEHRKLRRDRYYAYLELLGHPQEAQWAKTELTVGDQAGAIGAEGVQKSVFNSANFSQIGFAWIANLALLTSAIVLLVLGASAHLAASVRPKRGRLVWRFTYALLIVGGIGLWQWQAARVGMAPLVEIQRIFCCFTENRPDGQDNALALQSLTAGLGLLVPVLFVGLIGAITLFQCVPLATGLGRGLRGAAFPVAAVLFLLYAGSLLPTVHAESVLNNELANTTSNETHYYAERCHKVWPGDPQP